MLRGQTTHMSRECKLHICRERANYTHVQRGQTTHMSREGKLHIRRERANAQQNRLYQTTATRNVSAVAPKIIVSWSVSDSDLTITDPEFPSNTVLDNPPPDMTSGSNRGRPIKDDLKAALRDPDVLELVPKAVAAQVSSQLRKEIR